MEGLTGVVLAGGKSSRFGSDKAWVVVADKPMLQWVADALAGVCDGLVVVRAPGQALPALNWPGEVVVAEDRYEDMGPLAGFVSGFPAVATPLCFAVACDTPLLNPRLVTHLAGLAEGWDVVCPLVEERLQPLVAVYRPESCLPVFREFVERGNLKITAAFGRLRLRTISEAEVAMVDPGLESFRNANRPEEAAELGEILLLRERNAGRAAGGKGAEGAG
ncbi:MAG: molybdenum cofactor guanylyltransferase [Dehalococcoidia bacterium]